MKELDSLAVKAKNSEKCLKRLLDKLESRLTARSAYLPEYVKILHDQDGCLRSLVWDLVKRYNRDSGSFIYFLESNINFLIKTEAKKQRKFNVVGKAIVAENQKLYREPHYSLIDYMAERESFYLACRELVDDLSYMGRLIFKERINPSKRTIHISIRDAFNKGGSDGPVRLRWKHIAKSLKIPYVKVIMIVNEEVMAKANVIFRKYGFCGTYDYRDKPGIF